tara:strand:+ start:105 stop:236 length:132 start_codon:yes stop_codon:yes gene_type:complete
LAAVEQVHQVLMLLVVVEMPQVFLQYHPLEAAVVELEQVHKQE